MTVPVASPLDPLRRADWFDAGRARVYRRVLAAVLVLVALSWVALSRHGIDRHGKPLGTDFLAFWSASKLALAGTPASAWNLATLASVERGSMPVDPGVSSFLYPPPFLLACWPLALVPYFAALPLWLATTGTGYALAVRAWLQARRGWWLTLLAFPAVLTNVGHGQNGFLTAGLLGSGLWLIDRRPLLAGALLGCLIVKPQLAFAVPVLVLAGGRWRVLAGGVASATVLALASLAAFGPAAWHGFLAGAPIGRAILDQGLVEPGKMVSAYAAVRVLHGGPALAYAAQAMVAAAAALTLARLCRRRVEGHAVAASCAAATVLMSPFLLDYDLTATAIPLAWLFGEGLRRGFLPWEKLVLAAAFLLPLYARGLALAFGLPLAPLVLAALTASVARAALRSSPSRH